MKDAWRVWQAGGSVTSVTDLSVDQWKALEAAANFQPCSGRRADSLVTDELGRLWIIDTCSEAHAVDPLAFVAVKADQDERDDQTASLKREIEARDRIIRETKRDRETLLASADRRRELMARRLRELERVLRYVLDCSLATTRTRPDDEMILYAKQLLEPGK